MAVKKSENKFGKNSDEIWGKRKTFRKSKNFFLLKF